MDNIKKLQDNLTKRYSQDEDFSRQSQSYSPERVESAIIELNQELKEEEVLSEVLSNSTDKRIKEAKDFVKKYGKVVEAQHKNLEFLNRQLRNYVYDNKKRQESDKAYRELVSSPEYKDMTRKMREIKTHIRNLNHFLVINNVKGPIV
tara:strand:- start:947 stop:1390 length:444 start_codon:yes stop_codon:yes gene_type:complete